MKITKENITKFIAVKFVISALLLIWIVPLIFMARVITWLSNMPHTFLTYEFLPLFLILGWVFTFCVVMPLIMMSLNRKLSRRLGIMCIHMKCTRNPAGAAGKFPDLCNLCDSLSNPCMHCSKVKKQK